MYCFIGLSLVLSYSSNVHGIPAKMAFAVIKMLRCLLSNSMLQHFFFLLGTIFKEMRQQNSVVLT